MSEFSTPSTLLIVTNRTSIRYLLHEHLENELVLCSAQTRIEAINTLLNSSLDFIVIDAALEECDPLFLCQELRNFNTTIPILLITNRLKKQFRAMAVKAGITDFLSEDFDSQEIKQRIAAGHRADYIRKKTKKLFSTLSIPQKILSKHLKQKTLLHSQTLKLLDEAKKKKTPVSMLIIRIEPQDENQPEIDLSSFFLKSELLLSAPEGRFILLLPDTTQEQAQFRAQQIQQEIQKKNLLTISIALGSLDATTGDFHRVVRTATDVLKSSSTRNKIIGLDKRLS